MATYQIDYDEYNKTVVDWSKGARNELLRSVRSSGIKSYSGTLRRSFRRRHKKKNGMIYFVSFPFSKHGVWTWRGVGKGVPISKAGTPMTKRKPKDWIGKPFEEMSEKLQARLTPIYSDIIVKTIGDE